MKYCVQLSSIIVLLFSIFFQKIIAQTPQWAWVRAVNGPLTESANSIATDSQNGVYVYGSYTSSTITVGTTALNNNGGTDIFLIKYDTTGNIVWAKSFGSTGTEEAAVITTNKAGEIIICGTFANSITFGNITLTSQGGNDGFIAKLDKTGQTLWAKQIGGGGNESTNTAACDDGGNIYTAGSYNSTNLTIGAYTFTNPLAYNNYYLKMAADGSVIWAKGKSNPTFFRIKYINAFADGTVGIMGDFGDYLNFNNNSSIGLYTGYNAGFNVDLFNNGDFKAQTQFGQRFIAANGNMIGNNNMLLAGQSSFLSFSPPPIATLYRKTINPPAFNQSNAWGTDGLSAAKHATGNSYGRIYAVGNSIRNTSFGPITLYSTVTGFLIWEIAETSFTPVSVVPIDPQTTFDRFLNYAAIDTTTNTLYVAGDYTNITATPGNLTISNFVLPHAGGTEGFIGKLRLTKPIVPLTIVRTPDTAICLGGSANLGIANSIGGGIGPYTYSWQPPAGLSKPSSLTTTAIPNATTSYVLTVTDAAGQIIKDTVLVTVNTPPAVPLTTQTGNTLTSSSATGNQWYFNGNIITGATAQTYNYTTPGSYSVTTTNLNGCSTSSVPITTLRLINAELAGGVQFYYQISPNPVTQSSQFYISLTQPAKVSIILFNIHGQQLKIFANSQSLSAGSYTYPIGSIKQQLQRGVYKIVINVNEKKITHNILID